MHTFFVCLFCYIFTSSLWIYWHIAWWDSYFFLPYKYIYIIKSRDVFFLFALFSLLKQCLTFPKYHCILFLRGSPDSFFWRLASVTGHLASCMICSFIDEVIAWTKLVYSNPSIIFFMIHRAVCVQRSDIDEREDLFVICVYHHNRQYQSFPLLSYFPVFALQWRHNMRDGVSNHQPHDCLLKHLFGRRKKPHQSSASLAFVPEIHRWPVNSPHKWPVTRKMFPFDDVIMICLRWLYATDYL